MLIMTSVFHRNISRHTTEESGLDFYHMGHFRSSLCSLDVFQLVNRHKTSSSETLRLHAVLIGPPNLLSSSRQFADGCCKATSAFLCGYFPPEMAAAGVQSKISILQTYKAKKCVRGGKQLYQMLSWLMRMCSSITCCLFFLVQWHLR